MKNIMTTNETKGYNTKILGVDVPVEIERQVRLDFNEANGSFTRTTTYCLYANTHLVGYIVYRLTENEPEYELTHWGNKGELIDAINGAFGE